jgi:hypothetical protein
VYDGGDKVIFPNAVTSTENLGVFGYADEATFRNIHIGTKENPGSMTTTSDYLGGIVACPKNTAFTNCSNAATLSGVYIVGGIIGYDWEGDFVIQNCWNMGNITVSDDGAIVGGIAGAVSGENSLIEHCYNSGNMTVNGEYAMVGGITGQLNGDDTSVMQNCYNTGAIAGFYAGGICGVLTYSSIIACYNEGTVTGTFADEALTSGAGGIVGVLLGDEDTGPGIITACYNKGAVSSSADTSSNYSIHIGGITGNNFSQYGVITASYNIGTLSHTGSTSDSGDVYIGGISGISAYEESCTATIIACYWAGDGAVNGIGYKATADGGTVSDEGTKKFSDVWPTNSGEWGIGDGSGSGKYWKSLGNSPSNYPRLWFEE